MSLLFWKKKKDKSNASPENTSSTKRDEDTQKLYDLSVFLKELFNRTHYIAKSEYKDVIGKYNDTVLYFNKLLSSNIPKDYLDEKDFSLEEKREVLDTYTNIEKKVDEFNDKFIEDALIEDKEYLDNILKDVDPAILLDENQRKVVLCDEDYSLVIAGAGAGKTTTVAAKVKYLVEKQDIDPQQILVISFTNKAVDELKEKINKDLKFDCPIATFHSTGYAILRKEDDEKFKIVDDGYLFNVIQEYFKSAILTNEKLVDKLILFFASYFDAPYEGDDLNEFFNKVSKTSTTTLKSDLDEVCYDIIDTKSKKRVTIQNEILRSREEVEIANFLYMNQIEYTYEPTYEYNIMSSHKPYTPDFIIRQGDNIAYLEHFGIHQSGEEKDNKHYSKAQLEKYKAAIKDKFNLHQKHGTTLLYTFSKYTDGRSLIDHLTEKLIGAGFELKHRSNKEIMEKILSNEENKYIRKLVNLLCRFISNYKTNGYPDDEFDRMYNKTQNVRSRLFLEICQSCYLEYKRVLKENHCIDFQDMINESSRLLREVKEMKKKLNFKYIIVDEYQDISKQRFDLVKALSDVTDAKIIAVGDDWQSIYAFSGSDITLFTKFQEKMGYAKLLKIENTYRNSQEVIDIAGNFIQKNDAQIKKTLRSPKNITDPVIIYTYDGVSKKDPNNRRSGPNYEIAHAIEVAIGQIIEYNKKENKKDSSILLLGRYNFDGEHLERSGLFQYDRRKGIIKSETYPKQKITFMTAHSSKGLGYDNVIIINCRNETYGFPSKIEDDPVLSFVIKGDHSIEYAEERRLFYVAMTRTKNRVFFIAPEENPSEFLLEIKKDYKNVVLHGEMNEEAPADGYFRKKCPICGFPLQYRYKSSYGLKLFICTNEPELCGFMTNEYNAGKLSIMKCDKCQDGYLIARKTSKDGKYFLGCTNYNKKGTGCDNVVWQEDYYRKFNLGECLTEGPINSNNSSSAIPKGGFGKSPAPTTKKEKKEIQKSDVPFKREFIIKKAEIEEHTYNGIKLNETIRIILQGLLDLSIDKYYGVTMLIDVLQGNYTDRIQSYGLDNIPEFGELKDITKPHLCYIIQFLIDKGFILKTVNARYPVLHSTYNGTHYGKIIDDKMLKELEKIIKENEESTC